MRGVSTLRAKGTCVRPVALATMNTIERRIIQVSESFDEASTPQLSRDRLKTALRVYSQFEQSVNQFRRGPPALTTRGVTDSPSQSQSVSSRSPRAQHTSVNNTVSKDGSAPLGQRKYTEYSLSLGLLIFARPSLRPVCSLLL